MWGEDHRVPLFEKTATSGRRRYREGQKKPEGSTARLTIVFRLMHIIVAIIIDALLRPLIFWPLVKLCHGVREFWRGQRTLDWYAVPATVTIVRAKQKARFWYVVVGYYYSAEARRHPGVWSRTFVFERQVDKFLERYPRGSLINVRYCPGQASRSVVLDSDQGQQTAEDMSKNATTGSR